MQSKLQAQPLHERVVDKSNGGQYNFVLYSLEFLIFQLSGVHLVSWPWALFPAVLCLHFIVWTSFGSLEYYGPELFLSVLFAG